MSKRRSAKSRYGSRRKETSGLTYNSVLKRISKSASGRAALARYRRFWGIKHPVTLKRVMLPGPNKEIVLVGMGRTPALNLADGPKGRETRKIRRRHGGLVVCDHTGRKIMILNGKSARSKGSKKKFIGWVPVTEYIPTKGISKAGSFKKNIHWVHEHTEGGGKWPKAYVDSAGNILYGKGTYSVNRWIRR